MDGATLATFLETYRGRDKVYRIISYLAQFVAGVLHKLGHANASSRLQSLGSAFSSCRVILRLGDDLAMWQVTKSFGLGSGERHPVLRVLGVAQNVFDQLYYPLEHIAWACDAGLIKRPSAFYWVASIAAWGLSLCTSIVTILIKLHRLNLAIAGRQSRYLAASQSLNTIDSDNEDEGEEEDHAADGAASGQSQLPQGLRLREMKHGKTDQSSQHIQQQTPQQQDRRRQRPQPSPLRRVIPLEVQRFDLLIELVQHVADVMNAVHWMPPGFLWGGSLSPIFVGLNGVVSSFLGLYRMLLRHQREHENHDDS